MDRFTLCHVCVCGMGRLLYLFGSSTQAKMCYDCFIVGCFFDEMISQPMYWCHDSCMACVCVVVSLGSLRCSWFARSESVAFRVDSVVSRLLGGRGLSPLRILADIASVFNIKMRVCPSVVIHFSSCGVQSFTSNSHRGGARSLSSLSKYLRD